MVSGGEFGGRSDVLGKSISLDNHPFEILGVLWPGFTGIDVGSESDLYVPICTEKIMSGETRMLDEPMVIWLRIMAARNQAFPRCRPRLA
jgi:putative ABC transport system permease protein